MIKRSAIFFAHAIHVLVRNTLIIFVVLLLGLFIWLNVGIKVDSFKVSKYHVDGLYIKLDKKLTLKADKVTIRTRKANPSFYSVEKTLETIKYLLTLFNHIDLKEIHFDNNIMGIDFYDNILQLSSNEYLVRGNVRREDNMIIGSIPILQLKKQNITMRGEFSYNLREDVLTAQGKFLFEKTSGNFWASKIQEKINFRLKSDTFTDLKSIIDKFEMSPTVKSWVVEKVQAKSYELLSLVGKGDIVDKEFKMDMDALKGEVLFSDVSIDFKEGLAPVLAPSFILYYSNASGLFFDLEDPRYLGKDLDDSTVSIVNLRDDNTTLKLNLKFNTVFDQYVQKILQAYEVHVPVVQKDGKVNASLDMDIGLKQKFINISSDVAFTKGEIEVSGLTLPVEKGNLAYKDGFITLKDIALNHSTYEGMLNGTIDVKKKDADFVFDAKKVLFKAGAEKLIGLKNEKIPFRLNYDKKVEVKIPKFTLDFKNENNVTTLNISNLNTIKKYLSKAIPIEQGGNLKVVTKDFKTFNFNGVMKRSSCFIYEDNNICKTRVPFHGKATKDNFDFYAFEDRLHYSKLKSRIKIKNLNIDLEKFLAHEKKSKSKNQKTNKAKSLVILGTNSHLRYAEYSLLTDSYDVEIKPNGNIKALGSTGGDIVKFTKVNDTLTLQALRIKDKVLHPLINFDGLKNGRYSINKTGNPAKVMKGEIIVEGGVMKDFKAYNNTLAFINTVPALATLQKPGYSTEGFTITSGVVDYRMIGKSKIIFDSIYIKGDSATIVGKGELDLDKNTINIELGIQVARVLGKVVGNIPLVGHILVGKDKSITVGLQITGSLDKPEVSVSAAKDILSYPLQLIKRTIEAPQQLLAPESLK